MSKHKIRLKMALALGLVGFVILARQVGLADVLSLGNLKLNHALLLETFAAYPGRVLGAYVLAYILVTGVSLPGATVLTLFGGAVFGFWYGLVAVSIASTVGATLAFLISRFILRDFVENRFRDQLKKVNRGIRKDGAFYLLTLRLIPVVPFFLVNLVMGVTHIKVRTFFFVSQLGMLPATAVFVNAGTQLGQVTSIQDVFSFEIILSLTLIGLLPLVSKGILSFLKHWQLYRPYKKPKNFDYNVVVIGGGSAGLVSAYISAAVKAKVALVEKHKMGGDCLNTGCVPSKAIIRSAKVANFLKRAEDFGLKVSSHAVNFPKIMSRVHDVIEKITPHDSVERYTQLGVSCFQGNAKLLSPFEVQIDDQVVTTKNIILATGAEPFVPSIKGLKEAGYLTSDTIWNIKENPGKLVVIGGGPIGCELAQAFSRLGAEVTMIEKASRLMNREDKDVSDVIEKAFSRESVKMYLGCAVTEVEKVGPQKSVKVRDARGQEFKIGCDEILVAVGRKARVENFGLEKLGIEVTSHGTLEVNEYMQTRFPNIFACGDVVGPYQFTHAASHQAWFAAVNALFGTFKNFAIDYRIMPWCTFTDPEVARVGLSEEEAKSKGVSYEVTHYDLSDLDRAIADSEDRGFIKVLTEPGKDKILGVTIVGNEAGNIISEFVLAMKYGIGLNKILGTIHIYPTYPEANKYVAGVWKKNHAPMGVLRLAEKLHAWRR